MLNLLLLVINNTTGACMKLAFILLLGFIISYASHGDAWYCKGIYKFFPAALKKICAHYAPVCADYNKNLCWTIIKYYPDDIPLNHELLCCCLNSNIKTIRYYALNKISERGGIPLSHELKRCLWKTFHATEDVYEKNDILAIITICCYNNKMDSIEVVNFTNAYFGKRILEYSELPGPEGSYIKIKGDFLTRVRLINEDL